MTVNVSKKWSDWQKLRDSAQPFGCNHAHRHIFVGGGREEVGGRNFLVTSFVPAWESGYELSDSDWQFAKWLTFSHSFWSGKSSTIWWKVDLQLYILSNWSRLATHPTSLTWQCVCMCLHACVNVWMHACMCTCVFICVCVRVYPIKIKTQLYELPT